MTSTPIDQGLLTIAPDSVEDFVTMLLRTAIERGASDLHFHATEGGAIVSLRRLGRVHRLGLLAREDARRAQTFIKTTSGMDATRAVRPRDGRWMRRVDDGETLDIRISTIPTLFGEDMALRLLQRETSLLALDNLGLDPRSHYHLIKLLAKSGGLILVSGPTGAGKTTTLYACLDYLNDGTRKINTIEDPIEYTLPGIHQSQVDLRRNVDFPDLLRGVLRQSPDVIMVGEVRDPVTAETVVRAAHSGQLVFATCHAPSAAGAIESLMAFGVRPHFLAGSLVGVVAQRLVGVLCPHCKASQEAGASARDFDRVRQWLRPGDGKLLYKPVGCGHCQETGYVRRTAVAEVLRVSPTLRRLIHDGAPTHAIHGQAVEYGMVDLQGGFLLKVAEGTASMADLVRQAPGENSSFETDDAPDATHPAAAERPAADPTARTSPIFTPATATALTIEASMDATIDGALDATSDWTAPPR